MGAGFRFYLPDPAIFSTTTVTAGDFNADGRVDLAIGTPLRYTSSTPGGYQYNAGLPSKDDAGRVDVFFGKATAWSGQYDLIGYNDTPDLSLLGADAEMLGVLWQGPASDIDGDGIADLLVGAPGADRVDLDFKPDVGAYTLLRGWRDASHTLNNLPAGSTLPTSLAADGEMAVVLPAGSGELWYRFSTTGDGVVGNGFTLRGGPASELTLLRLDTPGASSGTIVSRTLFASLSGQPGGHYALRVKTTVAPGAATPATLVAQLPTPGVNTAAMSDVDHLDGGSGNDVLEGGNDIDHLYGGAGTDRFNTVNAAYKSVALFEARDYDSSSDWVNPLFYGVPSAQDKDSRRTGFIADPRVAVADATLRDAALQAVGKPVGSTLLMSDLLRITTLDLSKGMPTDINLAGLELFQNLRSLTINNRNLSSWTWKDARGFEHGFDEFRDLRRLNLANNRLATLTGLTGLFVVDDDRSAAALYTESGGSQTNWVAGRVGGVGGDYRFTDRDDVQASATWTLPALVDGAEYGIRISVPGGLGAPDLIEVLRNGVVVPWKESYHYNPQPGSDGLYWASVGSFVADALPNVVNTWSLRIRSEYNWSGLAADAVVVERGILLPARLTTVNLAGNPLRAEELDAAAPALRARLANNGGSGGYTLTLPSAPVLPTLSTPDFVDFSGMVHRNGQPISSGLAVLPWTTGTSLGFNGDLYQVEIGRMSIGHFEFEVVTAGSVTISVRGSQTLGIGQGMGDIHFRVYRGGAPDAGQEVLASGHSPAPGTDPVHTISLQPGRYTVAISGYNFSHEDADAGLPQPYSGAAAGRYEATVSGAVVRGIGSSAGTPTLAWSSAAVSATANASQLTLRPNQAPWVENTGEVGVAAGSGNAIRQETIRTVAEGNYAGLVYGTVFRDANANTVRDANETGLERYWVGIDFDGDGDIWDENYRVGALTDYRGRYVIDLSDAEDPIPSTARLVVKEYVHYTTRRAAGGDETTTLGDTFGLGSGYDVIGPRDLGLSTWGLPARVVVENGQTLNLSAPAALRVNGQSRTDLEYRWFVVGYEMQGFPTAFDPTQTRIVDGPIFIHRANRFDSSLTVVVAAFEQGQRSNSLAAAVEVTSMRVWVTDPKYSAGLYGRAFDDPTLFTPLQTINRTEAQTVTPVDLLAALRAQTDLLPWWESHYLSTRTWHQAPGTSGTLRFSYWDLGSHDAIVEVPAEFNQTGTHVYSTQLYDGSWNSTPDAAAYFRFAVTYSNLAPVISYTPPAASLVEGTRYTATPIASDPGGDTLAYDWQVRLEGQQAVLASGNSATIDWSPAEQGRYVVSWRVSDEPSEGPTTRLTSSLTIVLTVSNDTPAQLQVANAGDTQGEAVALAAAFVDRGLVDTHTFSWRIVDPLGNVVVPTTTPSASPTFAFTPSRVGTYQVTLTVRDDDNASASITRPLVVLNAPPKVETSGLDREVAEGVPVSFSASAPALDAGSSFVWTLLRGATVVATQSGSVQSNGSIAAFNHTPTDQGPLTVRLTVTDGNGGATTVSGVLLVLNAAPTAPAIVLLNANGVPVAGTGTLTRAEGQALSVRAGATDVAADPLSYAWQLLAADGSVLQAGSGSTWAVPGAAALQPGSYLLRMTADDGDGGSASVDRALVVTNALTSWSTPFSDRNGLFLGAARVDGMFEILNPGGAADDLRAEISWGDGSVQTLTLNDVGGQAGRKGASYSHVYTTLPTDVAGFQATVRVLDDEGSLLSGGFRVKVANGPRLLRSGGALQADVAEGNVNSYASYQLSLDAAPTAEVVIDVLPDEQVQLWDRVPTDVAGRQPLQRVIFTPANWATPRTVWLSARDDGADEAARVEVAVRHVVTSADPRVMYQVTHGSAWQSEVRVGTLDNDAPAIVVQQVGTQTTEAGGSAAFNVRLSAQPAADVTIAVYSNNGSEAQLSANALRFTPQNWNVVQKIDVVGVGDRGATGSNDPFQVVFAAVEGASGYAGMTPPAPLNFVNVNVAPPPPALRVESLLPTPSGFVLTFSEAVDVTAINLYEARDPSERSGSADLVVRRGSAVVNGSLVFDDSRTRATFVAQGGALAGPFSYTVELRGDRTDADGLPSRGFRAASGAALDGNGDGSAGDNYSGSFAVAAFSGATLSASDFARGPGQAVNLPALTAGAKLPLLLNTGGATTTIAVAAIDIVIKVDPALLRIDNVARGAALPADVNVSFSRLAGDSEIRVVIERALSFNLTGTALELLKIDASVPANAPYADDHVIDLEIVVNGGAINARADDAVHVAAYLGDVTADRGYGALDVQRIARVAAVSDTGFAKYPRLLPLIIGDITANSQPRPDNSIGTADRLAVLDVALGGTRSEIPALPAADNARPFADLATGNGVVNQPVSIAAAMGELPLSASTVRMQVAFDSSKLQFIRATRSDLTLGFEYVNVGTLPDGRTLLDFNALLRTQHAAAGVLALLEFRPLAAAAASTVALDVVLLQVDGGVVPLGQTPVSGPDAADGAIVVAAGSGALLPAAHVAAVETVDVLPAPAVVAEVVAPTATPPDTAAAVQAPPTIAATVAAVALTPVVADSPLPQAVAAPRTLASLDALQAAALTLREQAWTLPVDAPWLPAVQAAAPAPVVPAAKAEPQPQPQPVVNWSASDAVVAGSANAALEAGRRRRWLARSLAGSATDAAVTTPARPLLGGGWAAALDASPSPSESMQR